MKTKIFLVLTLAGILFLFFINTFQTPVAEGKIKTISASTNKVTIYLQNSETQIVAFTNRAIKLEENDEIKIYGKKSKYKNQPQIVADKIVKIK